MKTRTLLAVLLMIPTLMLSACDDDDDENGNGNGSGGTGGATTGGRAGSAGAGGTGGGLAPDAGAIDATAGRGGTGGSAMDAGTDAVPTAQVRVVHAAPDAPAVDLYVRGNATAVATGLSYGQATAYLSVPPGTYTFDVRPAGAPATSAPAFTTPALMLPASARITAIAAGLLGSTDEADRFRVLPLPEGFGMPATGNARVRVVHASPDAPAVAVDVGGDGMPEISSLARFADTGTSGVDLPADRPLAIAIWAGTPLSRVTSFTTPPLPAGAELFVIATGLLAQPPRDSKGFALLAVGPMGVVGLIKQDPTVYALHASPDAPAVDIFAGPTKVVRGLAFGALSAPVQIPPTDPLTLDFFPAAQDAARPAGMPVASAMTPKLVAGERYLAIATGFLAPAMGEPAFRLVPVGDELVEEAAKAKIRVVHASPDAPAVDVGAATGNGFMAIPGLTDLTFGNASAPAGVAVDPGMVVVGVAPAGTTTPAARFNLTLPARLRAQVVAAGALTPTGGQQAFRLLVVNTGVWPWTLTQVQPLP